MFGNRVERSVFFAFVFLTVLPLTGIGYFAIWQIEKETLKLAKSEQRATAKNYALTLIQRIQTLAEQIQASTLLGEETRAWVVKNPLVASVSPPPTAVEIDTKSSRPLLIKVEDNFYLGVPDSSSHAWVQLAPEQWWFDVEEVPNDNRICVLIDGVTKACGSGDTSRDTITTTWQPFLQSSFTTNFQLAVSADQSESSVLKTTTLMGKVLPLIIALVCAVTAYLGSILIRRKFRPLSELQRATGMIEQGNYDHRVLISTKDEFATLGEAFNRMSTKLRESFSKMQLLADVDRLILSSTNIEEIVESVLKICASSEGVTKPAVLLAPNSHPHEVVLYSLDDRGNLVIQKRLPWARKFADQQWLVSNSTAAEISGLPVTNQFAIQSNGCVMGLLIVNGQETGQPASKQLEDLADRLSVAATNFSHTQNLFKQAHFDSLTDLLNRNSFEDRLNQAIAQAQRGKTQGALIYIDLDRFKQVNDTEGHKAGDRLLRIIAQRLSGLLRDVDSIARLGGDEFGVVLPFINDNLEVVRVCNRIIAEVRKPVIVERLEHSVTASIGVAIFPDDGEDSETLLMCADAAMYRTKDQSGGGLTFYDQSINQANHRRVQLEVRLRRAIEEGNLKLVFQPKLDLFSNEVNSAEALMRWTDDELGNVSPQEFITIAEQTGLIHDIEPLLLQKVIELLKLARERECRIDHIAINASPQQINKEGYAKRLLQDLRKNDISPERIQVEVTESLFIGDTGQVSRELNALRKAGVLIALDDFGTGYSSLNVLTKLPLDIIKIDRSFLLTMEKSGPAREMVRHIVAIAETLEKKVVAEGVECSEQLETLREFGCHYAQGYLIARPMPAEELLLFIDAYSATSNASMAL